MVTDLSVSREEEKNCWTINEAVSARIDVEAEEGRIYQHVIVLA